MSAPPTLTDCESVLRQAMGDDGDMMIPPPATKRDERPSVAVDDGDDDGADDEDGDEDGDE